MPSREDERRALVESLLRRAHEQSLAGPERAPFWREGSLRCEYYRSGTNDTLKVFRGERCVHEEVVEPGSGAHARSQELRKALVQERGARNDERPGD